MEPERLNTTAIIVVGLLVGFFALMGTFAAWPAIAGWLPLETVPVKIADSDARMSGFSGNRTTTASAGFSVTTVDGEGTRQTISCPKSTYTALAKGYGVDYSVKLIRNPLFKTPVAFLKQPESFIKYGKGSAMEKLNSASPKKPAQQLPVTAYPIIWFVCGLLLFATAGFLVFRLLKIQPSRISTASAAATGCLAGIALGIYWTTGI